MTDYRFNRIAPSQFAEQMVQHLILSILERLPITALQFDADREIIAVRTPHPGGNPGMPGSTGAGNELDQLAVAPDQEVCCDAQALYFAIIGMSCRIQAIGKQVDYSAAAELIWRQTNGVDDYQPDGFSRGPLISVWRWYPPCPGQPALVFVGDPRVLHSFMPSRAMR